MSARPLSADDLADYNVELAVEGVQKRTVRAAYVTTEDGKPNSWLVFKNHQHQTVAQFNAGLVMMAERVE